jgi:hypothetical protein
LQPARRFGNDHRVWLGKPLQTRLQRFLPALLRRQFEGGIPAIVRQRKHLGNECGVLVQGRSLREQSIQLVEFLLGRIVV